MDPKLAAAMLDFIKQAVSANEACIAELKQIYSGDAKSAAAAEGVAKKAIKAGFANPDQHADVTKALLTKEGSLQAIQVLLSEVEKRDAKIATLTNDLRVKSASLGAGADTAFTSKSAPRGSEARSLEIRNQFRQNLGLAPL